MSRRALKIVTGFNVAVLCVLFVLHAVWLRQKSDLQRSTMAGLEVLRTTPLTDDVDVSVARNMLREVMWKGLAVSNRFERRVALLFYGAACVILLNAAVALCSLMYADETFGPGVGRRLSRA